MRIVLATPELEGGGIAAYTRSLAGELADLGHTVLVMAPRASQGAGQAREPQEGWPLPGTWAVKGLESSAWKPPIGKRYCGNLGRAVPFALAFARAVKSLAVPPDIVEAPDWDAPGALIALEGSLPVVTRLHGHVQLVRRLNGEAFRAEDRILAQVERLALRKSTLRAANSAYLADMSANDHRIDAASIAVLPLGVDVTKFRPGETIPAREALGLPQGVPLVGFAGRLEARKGLPLLIEAWRRIVRRHPNAVLVVAGGTPDGKALQDSDVVRDMRAAIPPGRLKVLGALPLDRMPAFYRAVDVICAPSVGEPFGLVVLEAMASGRPVVSLESGGVPEIVEDAVHGFLTEPGYVESLESALLRLLNNDLLRLKMGEAGRAQALGAFSVRHMACRTVEAYEMAVSLWQARSLGLGDHSVGIRGWPGHRAGRQPSGANSPERDNVSAGRFYL